MYTNLKKTDTIFFECPVQQSKVQCLNLVCVNTCEATDQTDTMSPWLIASLLVSSANSIKSRSCPY